MKYLLIILAALGLCVSSQAQTLLISPFAGACPVASTSVSGCVKVDGTSITISGGVISSSSGSPAFSAVTAGTNTAALLVGTGGSLGVSGTGTIAATSVTGLSVASGKTLTVSNSLTLAGTDGNTFTFPSGSDTVVTLAASQTLSSKTFVAPALGTPASGVITNLTGTCTSCNANIAAATAQTISVAGASSTPGLTISGLPFAGTGTTSTPQLSLGSAAPTTWSTGGTYIGISPPTGFVGNPIDVHAVNGGTSVFSITAGGTITSSGGYQNSGNQVGVGTSGINAVRLGSTAIIDWGSTAAYTSTADTTLCRLSAGVAEVGASTGCATSGSINALGIIGGSYQQQAASNTGGTCAMSSSTSCTITIGHTYTTPVCIATQQSATLTGASVGCTVSGTTVTITAAIANSETWGAFVFGNPT